MSDTPRCPNCGGPVVIAHPISSAEPLHICIACSPAEPDKLDIDRQHAAAKPVRVA